MGAADARVRVVLFLDRGEKKTKKSRSTCNVMCVVAVRCLIAQMGGVGP